MVERLSYVKVGFSIRLIGLMMIQLGTFLREVSKPISSGMAPLMFLSSRNSWVIVFVESQVTAKGRVKDKCNGYNQVTVRSRVRERI